MNNVNQVFLPIQRNLPVLSVSEDALIPGKAFDLADPRAVHMGSISWTLDAMEMVVFFGNRS